VPVTAPALDDADLEDLAAKRHARVGGGRRGSDLAGMRKDDRLVDGMEFGKSHECSPGRKERE
jgi:hypothetical protein